MADENEIENENDRGAPVEAAEAEPAWDAAAAPDDAGVSASADEREAVAETVAVEAEAVGDAEPVGEAEPWGEADSRGASAPVDGLPAAAVPVSEEPRGPSAEVKAVVEALIFAAPDPIAGRALCRMIAEEPKEDVLAAIEALKADYENRPGLQLVEVAGGYQIVTRPELHEWVRRLFHERSTQKLTVQGLETLAVIAYKQPITALEITEIRGVNTSGVLSTLLERHLIKIVGRKNVVGRPFLYATTKEFLIRFGLNDLTDLPKIEDMAEALGFDPPAGLIEQTPRDEILPLDDSDSEPADGTPAPDEGHAAPDGEKPDPIPS